MSGSSQLRLLLWKDYLVRKRKPITIGGVVWASMTILSLVIVRSNVDPDIIPTCQFKARALPSTGLLNFLQSFICTLNNDCEELEKYEEIPMYANSRLKLYQKQFQPIFQNETVVETIEMLPNSAKLVATVTTLLDDPEIHHIARDGLKISELFRHPQNVKSLLGMNLGVKSDRFDKCFDSYIKIENVIIEKVVSVVSSRKNLICIETFNKIFNLGEDENINDCGKLICNLNTTKIIDISQNLLHEINFKKYSKIVGVFFDKLTKKETISDIVNMVNSVLQLTDIWHYLPKELQMISKTYNKIFNKVTRRVDDFSYIDMKLIQHVVNIFEDLFSETEMFQNIRNFINTMINGFGSLNKVLTSFSDNYAYNETDYDGNQNLAHSTKLNITQEISSLSQNLIYFTDSIGTVFIKKNQLNQDSITAQVKFIDFILNLFPKKTVEEASYYLTLIYHLVEGAHNTLRINLHMEEVLYNVTAKHPNVTSKINQLGPTIIGKIIDGLADPNRAQVLTRKIFRPDQMFCDLKKIQKFVSVSKQQAEEIKQVVCNSIWNNYAADLIDGFGVNNISGIINRAASLIIAKTLGKNLDEQLISTTKAFYRMFDFLKFIIDESLDSRSVVPMNWTNIFDETTYKSLKHVMSSKLSLSKVALVTIHTALAREVIGTNSILQLYITPPLVRLWTVMKALFQQLQKIPKQLLTDLKNNLPDSLEVLISTLNNEKKALKVLTIDHQVLFCGLVHDCRMDMENCSLILEKNEYVDFPNANTSFHLAKLFCNISSEVSKKLNSKLEDDLFLKSIKTIIKDPDYGKDLSIDWDNFISTMQKIYIAMDKTFGFLFSIETDKLGDDWNKVNALFEQVSKGNTFLRNGDRAGVLGVNFILYAMQILDSNIFELNDSKTWTEVRHMFDSFNSVLYIMDHGLKFIKALCTEGKVSIQGFPTTSKHLSEVAANLPSFINDTATFVTLKSTNMTSLINIFEDKWPCSEMSLSNSMSFSINGSKAMKSIEALLCINYDLYEEWTKGEHMNKIISLVKLNNTINSSHQNIFLKTASNINAFTEDLRDIFGILKILFENDSSSKQNKLLLSWKYAIEHFNKNNQNYSAAKIVFRNIDVLLNSGNNSFIESEESSISVGKLWEKATNCQANDSSSLEYCKYVYWTCIKYSSKFVAEGGLQIVNDLIEYFSETSEPNANLLQLIGFTKKTGLHILYDKLPDFIEVLLNSYLDQGFIKQLYRSLGKQFWDCERLLDNMAIPTTSRINESDINAIKPYICPSLVHWVSIPINENILLDLIAKPQYIFFSLPVTNYKATFENFFTNILLVKDKIMNLTNKPNSNYSLFTSDWVNKFTLFPIDGSKNLLQSYYFQTGMNTIYITEITRGLNVILKNAIILNNTLNEHPEINPEDLKIFIKLLGKRPTEIVEMFIYAITDNIRILKHFQEFDFINSIDRLCQNETNLITEKSWIKINFRISKQFCKTNYKKYITISRKNEEETSKFEIDSISNFLKMLENISNKEYIKVLFSNSTSFSIQQEIFNNIIIGFNGSHPGYTIKKTTKYAHELGLENFLKYLDMQLSHFKIVLSFVSGSDWWNEVRQLYNSPFTNILFDVIEHSPEISYEIISNIQNLKIVRFLKDIKLNDTNNLCNSQLTDYMPDKTQYLSKLKFFLCQLNKTSLYTEIIPLKFAVQVYDDKFYLKGEVNDTEVFYHLENLENKLINFIIHTPKTPEWLNNNEVFQLRSFNVKDPSFKINMGFFILTNLMDAFTLFTNSSFSSISSNLTPLIKQINLQFIKQDEYVLLFCNLHNMNLTSIRNILIEEFHWDLALSEIYSGRNYTWIEMNKSLNILLEHVRYYLQDSINNNKMEKIWKCLIKPTEKDYIDNMAMHLSLGSNILKLIRANIPYLKNVNGFESESNIKHLYKNMKKNVPVLISLKTIINNATLFKKSVSNYSNDDKLETMIDLNKILKYNMSMKTFIINGNQQIDNKYLTIYQENILKNLNHDFIRKNIDDLRSNAFWSLNWLSNIVEGIESFLFNAGKTIQTLGSIDWEGLRDGQIESTINVMLKMINKKFLNRLTLHIGGMIVNIKPLFDTFEIGNDMDNLVKGLQSLGNLTEEFFIDFDLNIELKSFFNNWESIKQEIYNITQLNMELLNEIQEATIDIKPLIISENKDIHISEYICDYKLLSKVFIPHHQRNTDSEREYIIKKTSSKLCYIDNTQAKELVRILSQNLNYTTALNLVINFTITQIMTSSEISKDEGVQVVNNIGKIISLMPLFRQLITNVTDIAENEPLIASFRQSSSVSNLLSKPDFLTDVGKMLCGKPFQTKISRFYRVIAEIKDNVVKPDKKQLESLPTDYCRSFYKEILNMGGGKILWTYVKPLLMGKILYTPSNFETSDIIKYANESFSQIGRLTNLIKGFSSVFSSLDTIVEHKESLITIQRLLASDSLQNIFEKVANGNLSINFNVSELVDNFGNSEEMKKLVNRVSNMVSCVNLNRFVAVQNEGIMQEKAAKLMEVNEFMAGVVFLNTSNLHNDYKYKIRMDIDNVPSTSQIKHRFWMPGPNSNFIENLRYFRGFVQLQDILDKAIMSHVNNTVNNHKLFKRSTLQNKSTQIITNPAIYTQQMPYPCYVQDEFKTILYESQALVIAFFFSLMLIVASIVRHHVWERESGNTSLMCVMGMNQNLHTYSWFISSLIEMFVCMVVLCVILKIGNILPNSNPILVLINLLNFGLSVVMFCFMVTSMFRSASLGAVSAVIFYLICFMPYVIVIAMEAFLTFPEKIVTSLFMSSGFCYSILLTARYEVQGVGLQWDNFNKSPLLDDPITVANTFIIVIFDSLLYAVIGWIINYIRFRQNINLDDIKTDTGLNQTNIGVRVEQITKIYKNGTKERKALDNVTIDLLKGQITTLLGHNGAGKTTLIKILMGITKANHGRITINRLPDSDENYEEDANGTIKNHIGLCPQSDVLIESMTSIEHLSYYAQLKTGKNRQQVKYDVDSMVEIMGLGRLAHEPVHRLSGGLRRRLSVGLAFISNPHLVVLDEPSSGVDPVARRDIWSLIVGLKHDRTILLTTHHLDEAELLSDTLVVMHKGKVLTSCSPLELKHRYGDGYRLNVNYHSANKSTLTLKGENGKHNSITYPEELKDIHSYNISNSKELLNVVKENIANANIHHIEENNISFNLPSLNEAGQMNDFAATIQKIENMKQKLKYTNITMDCSTLEQVFLKVCKMAEENNYEIGNTKTWDSNNHNTANNSNSCSSGSEIISEIEEKEIFEESNNLPNKENCTNLRGTFGQQLIALLLKRFLHYKRNYRLLIITLVLPAVFVALAMGFSLIRPPADSENPIKLSPSLYNKFSAEFASLPNMDYREERSVISDLIYHSTDANNRSVQLLNYINRECTCEIGKQTCLDYENTNKNYSIPPKRQLMVFPSMRQINNWVVDTQDQYNEKRYGGWSEVNINETNNLDNNNTKFVVWYNNKGDHALPSYLNALNNAILKYNIHKDASITTYNHPFKLSVEQLSKFTLLQHVADVGIAVVLLIGFSLVPAGGAIYLVKERTNQQKRLQLLCGVSPFTYWLSTLIWDVLVIILAMILSVIVIEIFGLEVFTSRQNLPGICLLLLLYGLSCSTLIQLLEKLFNDASLANMIIFCFNVFIGVTGLTILLIIDVLSKSDHVDNIRWYLHKIFMIFPQFTLGDGLVEISKNSIQATVLSRFGMDTYLSPLSWKLMGYHHFAFLATAVIFFAINLAFEYHYLDRFFTMFQKNKVSTLDADMEDCDVATERYRVELKTMKAHLNVGMEMEDEKSPNNHFHHYNCEKNDILQVVSLRKIYKNVLGGRVAVENMTFGIKTGQCFGLLGVNGAGKSTTFKILTGELIPTNGHIFINGKLAKRQDLCNGDISYCPQVDALDPLITLHEHLDFYARLRGLENKPKFIKQAVREFDLTKYTHQKSETLSGGNKRKLCTAISLMGNSSIVLLDEPTSGMDPGARHYVGLAIKRAIQRGRCLLLSSHSLIECEDLCQVSAVTSLGRFVALGPPDYLKQKYGGGYLVSIRLKSPKQKGELLQSVCEMFPQTLVQNSHYCTTQFLVPIATNSNKINEPDIFSLQSGKSYVNTKLSDIFEGLVDLRTKLDIADYTVNQSSLDQVFINFSHNDSQTKHLSDMGGQIRLRTLERQYSNNRDFNTNTNQNEIFVTQF